jgi:chromosome segregation ATPase
MWSAILNIVSKFIPSLVGSVASTGFSYLKIAAIVALVSAGGYVAFKYNEAKNEIEVVTAKNDTLTEQYSSIFQKNNELASALETSEKSIEDIKKDVQLKEQLVSDFRIQKARDNKKLDDLSKKIASYEAKDDGPLAKVLKDAINGIKDSRENQGETKNEKSN